MLTRNTTTSRITSASTTTESGRRRCRRTKASQEARTTTPTRTCLWWKPGVAKGERLDRNEGTVCPVGENDFGHAKPKLAILAVKSSNVVKSPIRTAASNVVAIGHTEAEADVLVYRDLASFGDPAAENSRETGIAAPTEATPPGQPSSPATSSVPFNGPTNRVQKPDNGWIYNDVRTNS
ncbi:hypothetical protein NDA17_004659 [Ustilago hordei]|nr:hypothetical protein NDA17_004659 [Ustilago hordei]